jgi:hypothetical protein
METNTETIYTVQSLGNALTAKVGQEAAETLVGQALSAAWAFNDNTKSLGNALVGAKRDAEKALADLANGYHLNELGIFHSSARDANRYAAIRAQQIQSIKQLAYLISHMLDMPFGFDDVLRLGGQS